MCALSAQKWVPVHNKHSAYAAVIGTQEGIGWDLGVTQMVDRALRSPPTHFLRIITAAPLEPHL